jgi:acyl dehydratase
MTGRLAPCTSQAPAAEPTVAILGVFVVDDESRVTSVSGYRDRMTATGPGAGVRLGRRVGPFESTLDIERLRSFAAATKDPFMDDDADISVPPLVVVTLLWDAQNAGRLDLVPGWLQKAATSGVHGEHDVVVHRPLVPDERLSTWVEGWSSRTAGRNAAVTLRYATLDAVGILVAEQWWTTVWLGVTCDTSGSPPAGHSFPDAARAHPIGHWREVVDEAMARRYAVGSGDWSAHHFELEAARRSGSDRVFLHGLCTMALCGRGIAEILGCSPERLRRVAVRFASPMPLGQQLDVHLYAAADRKYAFEATSSGVAVVTNGQAEVV